MRPTQRNEKELSERTAFFFARRKGVHYFPRTARRDMPPASGRGKGAILFRKREYPLWNPKRKAFDWQFRTRMTFRPPEWECLRAALPRLELLYDLTYFYYPLVRSRWRLCCLTDAAHPLRVPLC